MIKNRPNEMMATDTRHYLRELHKGGRSAFYMHFSGNKSILGDSLLSYFPVPQFSRSAMRCNNYCSLSASFTISIIRKTWRGTWPGMFWCPSLRLAILGKCVSSLIVPPTQPNDAFSQVFNFYVVLQTSYIAPSTGNLSIKRRTYTCVPKIWLIISLVAE